jgi:hypothetical protein
VENSITASAVLNDKSTDSNIRKESEMVENSGCLDNLKENSNTDNSTSNNNNLQNNICKDNLNESSTNKNQKNLEKSNNNNNDNNNTSDDTLYDIPIGK